MKEQLKQIYEELSNGWISQSEALERVKALKLQQQSERGEMLMAVPVWQTGENVRAEAEYGEYHVLDLRNHLAEWEDVARRYSDHAAACFERIQSLLQARPEGRILLQVIVEDHREHAVLAGLSGLLQSAARENPQFSGQVLLVPHSATAEELVVLLEEEKRRAPEVLVRYEKGARQILRWRELTADSAAPRAFRDDGVYLITGGLGALGMRFAGEVLRKTSDARVVLTGRHALDAEKSTLLAGLSARGRVSYKQVDLGDPEQVIRLMTEVCNEHGRLNGILHCAGAVADNFIVKKRVAEFRDVLVPKVTGTFNLDRASADLELDFFVLFSSVVGAMGNVGQCDYAAANAFMDQYAAYRNRLVEEGRRHGRTRSINWPVWEEGGIGVDSESRELLRQATGIVPMQTASGIEAFHRIVAWPYDQVLVAEGDLSQIRRLLGRERTEEARAPLPAARPTAMDEATLAAKTEDYLRRETAEALKLPLQAIDAQAALERYGIDSILAMKLTSHLEKTFGTLPKTLFFEYQTLRELTGFFVRAHPTRLAALFLAGAPPDGRTEAIVPVERRPVSPRRFSRPAAEGTGKPHNEPIAIIGLSGRYPEAIDLEAYWRNLRAGRDCIVEVPPSRWDWREYYSGDRTEVGRHYSRWGGFIAGVDEFDPLFFNISPKEARALDPQERLFLQHAWMAIEDAGYTRQGLQTPDEHDLPGQVGVYVGVMYTEYQLFGAEAAARGARLSVAASGASIANRVSFALNLHGPSVTLDTMCSSSLTAIHFACLDLKLGRTSLAIAGGVNVTIHPNKYLFLSAGQFISSDGHCQSFGEGGDGYIPGEGVGAVVLKRLADAERDGDHIYGIIRGSALNHGGRTNGFTVPNPQAQATAISRALAESGVDARYVSYVEAHGTGTKLGDPIEIAALNKAFQRHTRDTAFCMIGSAKSNIGHCESAAGVAGLTKVLLQMQHREIVPSLHSAQLNPHIDFDSSPFIVNQDLRTWEQPVIDGRSVPRIAGISSFGAGGSNAHMIIEEYPLPVARTSPVSVAIVLSARTPEQLRQKAGDLLAFVQSRVPDIDLESMAYTLQTGREAMDERLGFVVDTPAALVEKLDAWLNGRQGIENTWQGQIRHGGDASSAFTSDADLQQAVGNWIAGRKLSRLVEQWVRGLDLDWSRLYGQPKPRRMSLPVYPFARERYWVELPAAKVSVPVTAEVFLHPLLHRNTSDLTQQSYEATLPAASLGPELYFEMARAAVVHAARVAPDSTVELRDVVWVAPPNESGEVKAGIALLPGEASRVDFEIYSDDVVLCQGGAIVHREPMTTLDGGRVEGEPRRLSLSDSEWFPSAYVLHPAIVKAAIETGTAPVLIPFAVDTVRILSPCTREMVSTIRRSPVSDGVTGGDLDLIDGTGRICAQLRGLRLRETSPGDAHATRVEPATAVSPRADYGKPFAPAHERVRREIALDPQPPSSSSSPAATKRLAAISLTAPAALTVPAPAPFSPKRPVVLTTAAEATASPVKLHDCGNGIFAVDVAASRASNVIAGVMQALERVQQESTVKVLMLSGIEHCFPRGGRAEYNEALEQGLFSALAEFPVPLIGLLRGDVIGAGFLAASLCDVLVCCESAQYSFRDTERCVHPTDVEVRLFRERFGETLAEELLYGSLTLLTGRQLQAKGWTCPMVPWEEVDAHAEALSAVLAAKSESALRLLKQHLARRLRALVKELAPVDVAFAGVEMQSAVGAGSRRTATWLDVDALKTDPEAAQEEREDVSAPAAIPLSSAVVTATVHPKGIVVVTMADRAAKNMFSESLVSGLKEAFAHIARTPAYKVVILTGVDGYFASGGTKETLLAIQEGKTRFTDDAIYEAALDCELPVIAAMQGHGIGAGWCLGMYADLVVLSEESRYVSPYMDYGFTPGAGATWILPETLGRDVAVETLFTAQSFTGRELKARGVSLPIVPQAQVLAEAMSLAERIAGASRSQLIALKHERAARIRAALSETYPLELAMHEKTFVGRSETLARIETNFLVEETKPPIVAPKVKSAGVVENVDLADITATLKKLLAGELQMREGDIGDHAQFVDLGLDSVGGVSWIRKINQRYQTSIEAVKIYAYPTLDQLSRHVREEAERSGAIAHYSPPRASGATTEIGTVAQAARGAAPETAALQSWRGRAATRFAGVSAGPRRAVEPIAVIGMAGQFPLATNLDEFWRNIAEGKNCIVQVPRERWDVQTYYQPGEAAPGKTNSQWLGALDEYDRFDPLFFNISPSEAELMDPQQRLFLQACWHSIEDAGYAARSLSGSRCGVFVGCSAGDYHQMSREHQLSAQGFTGSATSILAARISYLLNLQGPCLSIDTACSSSLVAIAEACESLLAGDSDVALAGGVCVLSGPDMHIKTAQAGMLSPEGRCFTFDQRADGFVPGEGVGVIVLKRLSDAERDGDLIHGVIAGWGVNQDGKTNGITAPNPESQTRLEQYVYDKYSIDPAEIQLIEAHGTGTKLGDPIEIEGLKKAFAKYTDREQYCAVGSVKSNIGHTLTAAGIAGVIKVLLALRAQNLPPTIHFERLNEHIDLSGSPFYVIDRLRDWAVRNGARRQAAVSSFGFSGTNAHLVIAEAPEGKRTRTDIQPGARHIVPLSARTEKQLRQKGRELLELLRVQNPRPEIADVAYTLQVGREALEERVGFIVASVDELVERLASWLDGRSEIDVRQGRIRDGRESLQLLSEDDEARETLVGKWIAQRKLPKLLGLWVKGLDLDWSLLYRDSKPRRIRLPLYPFAKERYWIEAAPQASSSSPRLHPLLHVNTSDFQRQSYRTTFSGQEFFLTDHQVRTGGDAAQKILPGMAYLEMARAAIEHASAAESPAVLELRDTVWTKPLVVSGETQLEIVVSPVDEERIEYEIFSGEGEEAVVHCHGRAAWRHEPALERIDLEQLEAEMRDGRLESGDIYAACAAMGLYYGPAFQAVTVIHRGNGQALARLRLPGVVTGTAGDFILHPSLLDSAVQSVLGVIGELSALSRKPRLPFALESLRVLSPCVADMAVWVRTAHGSQRDDGIVRLDLDLCDAEGRVCVQMRGLSLRVLETAARHLLATPVWQSSALATGAVNDYSEHQIILCGLPSTDVPQAVVHTLSAGAETNIARRYVENVAACFVHIRRLLAQRPTGRVLLQCVTDEESLVGLSGLLRTATLENPHVRTQLIVVPKGISAGELGRTLRDEKDHGYDPLVRYEHGARQIVQWQEIEPASETPLAYKDEGVYLITGGLGAIGRLFATEILDSTQRARIVVTGRSELTAAKQSAIAALPGSGARASYRQVDLGDADQVMRLVSGITQDYGRLDGILHCAGAIADEFIIRKSEDDLRRILAPKVLGTFHLDEASGNAALDWFVLFSSVASAMGNAGQADYAAANGFLDQFAVHRNRQVAAGRRHGRTVSILWPLWEAGGMSLDSATREVLQHTTGMAPLRTATGLEAFRQALSTGADRILVAEGDVVQIRRALVAGFAPPAEAQPAIRPTSVPTVAAESLAEQTRDYLGRQLATVLKVPAASIDPQAALERYGIDSILALKLTAELEKTFGALSRTLFFEYRTIDDLSRYFLEAHAARLTELFRSSSGGDARPIPVDTKISVERKRGRGVRFARAASARPATESEPIAIIGLSGRYPEAFDIDAYWNNLRDGKDCITEVPPERWNWRDYFSEDRTRSGHHYSRWGGFIAGVDEFDPLFFNIAPKEAKLIDPQERLFLQHSWMALEDAGYTRAGLQLPSANDLPGQVGVYVGVMYTEYQLFGPESTARGNRLGVAGSAASIANRVSYVLNVHGPSVTLDTMCSSSLTAIHYACQDLKNGRTALAIAGGVNVSIHPNKYLVLSQGQFISSDGHCQSFGEGGDGYIPGEGVGVVVLKRLSEARKDGDHVYGVIRGSALNHGGRTNGYSVPNPQAQAGVISRVLAEARVDAREVSYIEAHGTGTKLGDPIEIAALSKAFERFTKEKGFCRIGSAKSNIGHCESAAGIAGLTKVLLQMQHRQIVPSLHSERLNPHIDFERTPFVVNQSLCPWEQPVIEGRRVPRIAGISSFGAGGSNAHVIVEEAEPAVMTPPEAGPVAVLLSARTDDQLRHKVRELLDFVRARMSALDLTSVAYTLQVGRESMDERVGFIVDSLELLTEKLQAFLDGDGAIDGVHQGQVKRGGSNLSIFVTDRDLQETIDKWIAGRKLSRLVELWVKGVEPEWSRLYGDVRPARVSLPTYPFARERYWIDIVPAGTGDRERSSIVALHPLVHRNTSNLSEQRYTSVFTGEEPFVLERGGRKVLMEAACLEMARAAVEQSLPDSAEDATLEFRDMDWLEPALVVADRPIHVSLCENDGGEIEIEIYSSDAEADVMHWRGTAAVVDRATPIPHSLGLAAEQRIALRKPILDDSVLDPAVLQSALEGAAGGAMDSSSMAIDSLRIVTACQREMVGSVQRSGSGMDVDLCDARGNVCVEIRGLHVAQGLARPASAAIAAGTPATQSERKKPSISLTAPGEPWAATASSAPRPAVTLAQTSARQQRSSMMSAMSDERGDGVVTVRIDSSSTPLRVREALERIQNNPGARVVTISGLEELIAERELLQAIAAFPLPLVAVLRHDTVGAAFLYAALCDFMVCNETAQYGYAEATPAEESLLSERFGEARIQELLHGPEMLTGGELRKRGWTCPIVPAAEVDGRAQEIASALASRSREALGLLAPHLKRRLIPFAAAVTFSIPSAVIADGPPPVPRAITAPGDSMDLEARQEVLVARLHENAETEDLLADLGRLFKGVAQDSFYKAIVLAGAGELFPALTSENLLQFQRLLEESHIPVIAALEGNAKGNGWLAALLCDGCLYSRDGVYSAAGIDEIGASVVAQRLGNAYAREILLTGADCTGAELQRRAGIWIEERERVLPMAVRLAAKRGMTRGFSRPSLTIAAAAKEQDEAMDAIAAAAPIALRSQVVRAMAHPDGIVVVTMEDRDSKNMFSEALAHGLSEAFEQIGRSPQYKAVVLTGYDQYFSSGGTRESLLAIQAGTARFTDSTIFRLPLDCPLPVIAAMQGHGIGAGWSLGMFADVVVLSDESRYVSPYMDYGFTPGAAATWSLPDKLGEDLARESLMTAQPMTGVVLKARGSALRIVPRNDALSTAMALAGRIVQSARSRLIALKRQLIASVHEPLDEALRRELAMHDVTFVGRPETLARIESRFQQERASVVPSSSRSTVRAEETSSSVRATLRTLLAQELQTRESDIDDHAEFVDLGLDSVSGVSWIRRINDKYGTSIEATRVYSHPTLAQLSAFVQAEAEALGALSAATLPPAQVREALVHTVKETSRRRRSVARTARRENRPRRPEPIAVIGMAGQFPQANDVDEFWQNLAQGRNCISVVPRERWDVRAYYQPGEAVAGKTNSQWLGAVERYDRFDPLFFNISPVEAEAMDPQQRLFLEACWHSIEDAGYDARALSGSNCGVFVGCAYSDYHKLSRAHELSAQGFTGNATSILAARISYFLDLQGACVSIDTACSSSLVAIAQACDSLTSGESDLALAGGVYVMAGPEMHIRTAQAGMLSPEGRCFTFDHRADGFVVGEGVGVIVLKRLADARKDGDAIYGVIEGWGVNQDGRSNGITAPNPESQIRLEQGVYDKFSIDPAQIQLVEAHGTATKLGDPIEIEALKASFRRYTQESAYCALGSVKSNIGHCLTAAGAAGVIKVLLALRNRQLPPTINFERLNEHIDLSGSPFYVNTQLRNWELNGATERRAAVSSFGFSGTNAHLVIAEAAAMVESARPAAAPGTRFAIVLSARDAERLGEKARDLLAFVRNDASVRLDDLAYTLQTGRAAMDERLAFAVTTVEELVAGLQAVIDGRISNGLYRGRARRQREPRAATIVESREAIERWIAAGNLEALMEAWTRGAETDWKLLYGAVKPRRIRLPLYPFARERYWIESQEPAHTAAVLHPLLHTNVSDVSETRFVSKFSGTELFLDDHRMTWNGSSRKVLPFAALLEMARAAIAQAWPIATDGMLLELRDIVCGPPLAVDASREVQVSLSPDGSEAIAFEIYSTGEGEEIVHCQGRAALNGEPMRSALAIEALRGRMERGIAPESAYAACEQAGSAYGASLRGITALQWAAGQILAELVLPQNIADSEKYVLHPTMLEGALQAALMLGDAEALGGSLDWPVALKRLRIAKPSIPRMFAWVRRTAYRPADGVVELDLDLCDEGGVVCVELHGLSLGALSASTVAVAEQAVGTLLAAPVWRRADATPTARKADFAEHHLLLCGSNAIDAAELESLLPHCHPTILREDRHSDPAQRFRAYAVACFERVQTILQNTSRGRTLVQLAIAGGEENGAPALSALLRTAAVENPHIHAQTIVVDANVTAEELSGILNREREASDPIVRFNGGVREVLQWEEVATEAGAPPLAFQDDGVYLITGGLGGLGTLFTREILEKTRSGRVVLTGRSALDAQKEARLSGLDADRGRLHYEQVDLGDPEQVKRLVDGICERHGRLDGILHCAGTLIAGHDIVTKSSGEFLEVLEPKVTGTVHLDEASRERNLDFFVLFSSIAGTMGNPGTADYATANAFLDWFAGYRNRLVSTGLRHGRTRAIDWPWWQAGGMQVDPAGEERLRRMTGMLPMQTSTGMAAFHRSLALPHDQILVAEGMRDRLVASYLRATPTIKPSVPDAAGFQPAGQTFDVEQIQERLKALLSTVLRIQPSIIDIDQAFVELGLDSFLGTELVASINRELGTTLSNLMIFDHPTVRELARFLREQIGIQTPIAGPAAVIAAHPSSDIPAGRSLVRRTRARRLSRPGQERIAIIGMSGRYPQAGNLRQYWQNLAAGRSSIIEVPASRWDVHRYYDPDPTKEGRTISKWLGALDDIDRFDPLFFRISPQEADSIDPHHRLFLEESYKAFEDAGYSSRALANRKCGVYLGISSSEYALLLAKNRVLGDAPVTSNHTAIAAARIAYHLNLKGPAISVDTACSSSLVAIHLACQALRSGETDMALAGGVTLWLTPESYLSMTQAGMLSPTGRCKAFDDSADGIVVADGVGAVVLKRLSDAEADGDIIHGVILGSGINQDGRTNGITAPSIQSQIELERSIYEAFGIDPGTIDYVEAHGTGTSLGDPIELEALSTVFTERTARKNFCAVGSVKSNIGHTVSAAGVASVQKVLLALRHRTLVPTLHVTKENSRFDFANSPFYVNRETKAWSAAPGALRRAAVSSFGFSGTNAHLVIEEYPPSNETPRSAGGPVLVPLSARTPDALRQRASDLLEHIRSAQEPIDLGALAYTLQIGREPMEERLGVVVSSVDELAAKLSAFVSGATEIGALRRGRVEPDKEGLAIIGRDEDMQEAIERWIARGKLAPLLDLWIRGLDFDFNRLYGAGRPPRISLPTYPFARERCWVDESRARRDDELAILPEIRDAGPRIDEIMKQIAENTIDAGDAVQALRSLV